MAIKTFWHNISFIGLSKDQEFSHREVFLLNKLALISTISMLGLIPFEVILNGWGLVMLELGMALLCSVTLLFNYYKKYTLAKFYYFFMAYAAILTLAVAVGPGTGNELFLIPGFIMAAILFNDRLSMIALSVLAFLGFCAVPILHENTTAFIDIPIELKKSFRFVMYTTVFVFIFFEVYYFKSISGRFQKLLSRKNELIEEKNKEIVDSINYAQRIQDAYLPPKDLLKQFFKEAFLFFEPKDIVSGDFYWFYSPEPKDEGEAEEVFVIAADCTGHGVPGAIMSVICCNALNEVIIKNEESDTGKILDGVREQVVKILKTDTGSSRKDGMDVAVCKINLKTNMVQYSGANNALWIHRKNESIIEVIKADKQPVGYYENQTTFTSNDLQLEKGDKVYLFSDGYQDQFGGEKGKKFKAANLKHLLLSSSTETMTSQLDQVKKAFNEWKGDLEQVDDVVLIGIRL